MDKLSAVIHLDGMDPEPHLVLKFSHILGRLVGAAFLDHLQDAFSAVFINAGDLVIFAPVCGEAYAFIRNVFDVLGLFVFFFLKKAKLKHYAAIF